MDKMQKLVDRLNQMAYEYYVLDSPTYSDKEYDALYDELVKLEKETNIVLNNSPTKRIGGEVLKGFNTHKHLAKLYSLDKCKNLEELFDWIGRVEKELKFFPECTIELKYDGLTINLTYEDGYLKTATTRGDGEIGENITEQAKTIKSIPLSIPYLGLIEIQGEGLMFLSAFEKYNKSATELLKNPRNAAAGAIRNLDPKVTSSRKLDMFAYNVNYSLDKDFKTQVEINDFLVENKFLVGKYFKLVKNKEQFKEILKDIEKKRDSFDFLIDGAVIKINDIALRDKLGYTEKFPRWAIAYKFKADEVTTKVLDVIWQISRTGKLNPLAILEPVEVGGATVKRATLNNYQDIKRKDIKIGSRVFIRRSNDVIPEILSVASHKEDSREIIPPEYCPACNTKLVWDNMFLKCPNTENCAPAIISQIVHFASKPAMNIEGLSDKTVEQLYNEINLDSFSKIYQIKKDNLLNLEGFRDRKIKNLLNAIEKSKKVSLSSFIFALGIPNIGKKASRELANTFKTIEALKKATYDELIKINDFGDIMASDVENYFKNQANLDQIDNLIKLGITIEEEIAVKGIFSGENIVITGSLKKFTRGQAQQIIIDLGGVTSDSVSKNTTCLIYGENAGSKYDKAVKLNIPLMTEEEFLKKIEG